MSNLRSAIIADKQREMGYIQTDTIRASTLKAVDYYLSLPLSEEHESTYSFWRQYSMTTDKAQKCLCNLARIYLTPPPTSTGMCNIFATYSDKHASIVCRIASDVGLEHEGVGQVLSFARSHYHAGSFRHAVATS